MYSHACADSAAQSRQRTLQHPPSLLPPPPQVYAELSWDLERAALQLDKLQSFFLAGVEAEHAALHAFSGPACLASFRLVALPAGLQQRLAALAAQVREEAARAAAGAELSSEPSKAPVPGEALQSKHSNCWLLLQWDISAKKGAALSITELQSMR